MKLVQEGYDRADAIMEDYNMGLITNNERYNQIIDVWTNINTKLTKAVIDTLVRDDDGFNPVYMMLDSGARGSKEQIRQLSGMRGLMAKPQKSGVEGGQQVIENPILSNFKEGLSVLEYFISTHGARKGLADTALKTADAGYLTRRLVDVAQDVIINEEDCGTLRGLTATAIKRNDDVVQTLYDRILGRVALNDVIHPLTGEVLCKAGEEITEPIAEAIEKSPLESVEIRSVLTCESRRGVCAKCYGRNLATARMVQKGEVVGVIAAQSIGEPGTQLTLRTFPSVAWPAVRPSRPMSSRSTKDVWRSTNCAPSRARMPPVNPSILSFRVSRSSGSSIPRPKSYSIRTTCPMVPRSTWRTVPRSRRAT